MHDQPLAGDAGSAAEISISGSFAAPYLLSVLRIFAAFLFIQSGTMKLFGFPIGMPEGVTADLWSQTWFGGVLETFGGLLILIGLGTRSISFILSGMMAVAYFQFHQPQALWPVANGGQPAILFCFVWLYLAAAGGGPWSIDAMFSKRSKSSTQAKGA